VGITIVTDENFEKLTVSKVNVLDKVAIFSNYLGKNTYLRLIFQLYSRSVIIQQFHVTYNKETHEQPESRVHKSHYIIKVHYTVSLIHIDFLLSAMEF
jgi:hypothetical protein